MYDSRGGNEKTQYFSSVRKLITLLLIFHLHPIFANYNTVRTEQYEILCSSYQRDNV